MSPQRHNPLRFQDAVRVHWKGSNKSDKHCVSDRVDKYLTSRDESCVQKAFLGRALLAVFRYELSLFISQK